MNPCENCSFLILAGGKSRRMGTPKEGLRYENHTFLEALVERGRALSFGEIIISGLTPNQLPPGLVDAPVVCYLDELEGRGPLGGLYTGLKRAKFSDIFVVTVDCPAIPAALIAQVVAAHVAGGDEATLIQRGEGVEPLIGVYSTSCGAKILPLIQGGPAPVYRGLDHIAYGRFPHPYSIRNVNTREDYEGLLRK